MSKLRPNIVGPCVFCLVLGALYFLGSTGSTAMADRSSRGGLPAALDRIETLEDALGLVMQDLDSQAMLINAWNFDLNARIDLLADRVTVLEGGGGDIP
jgi:hypothetical protein